MDEIPVDRRTIRAARTTAEVASLRTGRDAWLDRELALARTLAAIDVKGGQIFEGCATVPELASMIGYDGLRAMDLLDLGRALAACAELEVKLRNKRIPFASACVLGKILPFEQYLRPDDRWLFWAEISTVRALRRLIRLRITQVKDQSKDLRAYEALVDEETLLILERCEHLASGKNGKSVTRGQMLHTIGRHYLEDFDPIEKELGTRRTGPTSQTPFGKYVPVAVAVAIYRRAGGLCEVGGCKRRIEQICHVRPRAGGSPREEKDLFGACGLHHKIYDVGLMKFLTWTAEGRPVFCDRMGRPRMPVPRDRCEPDEAFLAHFKPEPPTAADAGATPAVGPSAAADAALAPAAGPATEPVAPAVAPAPPPPPAVAPAAASKPKRPPQPDRVSEGSPLSFAAIEGTWADRHRFWIRTGEGAINDPAPPRVRLPPQAGARWYVQSRRRPAPARRVKQAKPAPHARPPPKARSP